MSPVVIAVYIVGCLIAGWLGKNSRFGFVGSLIFAVIFTPLPTILAILLFAPPGWVTPPERRTASSRSERARYLDKADP